jgi:DNA end-binding protein Ku
MAPRSFWKGYLKLSLVTCPVTMMPATGEGEKVRFHTLNAKTGRRVVSQYVDAVTGKPVAQEDEIKGYEHGEDDYVLLEDDELESARTIDIQMFVDEGTVGWIWYDKPHDLRPDDRVAEEAFAVIREAMVATKAPGQKAGRGAAQQCGQHHGCAAAQHRGGKAQGPRGSSHR